jgi:hypothetical protein
MHAPKQHWLVTEHAPPTGVQVVPPPSGGAPQTPPVHTPVQQSLSAVQDPPAAWQTLAQERPVGELGSGKHWRPPLPEQHSSSNRHGHLPSGRQPP